MHARWAVACAKAMYAGLGAVALVVALLRGQSDTVVWHVTVNGLEGLFENVVNNLEIAL